MQAWCIKKYGGPGVLSLTDVPDPIMGDQDVLVSIAAASVNPIDWKIRKGMLKPLFRYRFPLILGNDFSGVVTRVGSAVTHFKEGDQVYGRPNKKRIGTWASLIAVHQDDLALKPQSLSLEEAAGIPLVGLTCMQAMTSVKAGQKMLIHAGAGGVGTFAVQLARHRGAEVATTASAPKHPLLKSLGADHLIDYRERKFWEELKDLDFVFDTLGGMDQVKSFSCLKRGGRLVSITGPIDNRTIWDRKMGPHLHLVALLLSLPTLTLAAFKGCSYRFLLMKPDRPQLEEIAGLIDRGIIKPVIDRIVPFEKADEAVAYAETGRATGKVIIRCGPE